MIDNTTQLLFKLSWYRKLSVKMGELGILDYEKEVFGKIEQLEKELSDRQHQVYLEQKMENYH